MSATRTFLCGAAQRPEARRQVPEIIMGQAAAEAARKITHRLTCSGCGDSRKPGAIDHRRLGHSRRFTRGIKGDPVEIPTALEPVRAIRPPVAAERASTARSCARV